MNATSKQKQTLQTAVTELNLNIQKLTKSITLTQAEITQKDREIQNLSGSISDTSTKIDRSHGQVGNSLRQLDIADTQPQLLTLLVGGTLSEFFDEAANLTSLRIELERRIQELSTLKEEFETDKDVAEEKRQELAGLQRQLNEQKQGLAISRDEQTKLLNQTKNKESTYQSQIAQKQAEQKAFESALFDLASQLEYVLDPSKVPAARGGVLQWPLDNVQLTQQFGKTADSGRLYTSGTHDGIDLRASVGTPVRAAMSGTILEVNHGAAPNCQYGKWVIVRHPNGLATLYAHLSNINVGKGQTVATGQVLGYSGSTGYATGPHLHFTVYVAEAISMKQYTCKSGAVVTVPIAPLNAYLNPLSYLPR
jgi:murein DD-endopeptidase MepM/ murein hydrolase activator NlpD